MPKQRVLTELEERIADHPSVVLEFWGPFWRLQGLLRGYTIDPTTGTRFRWQTIRMGFHFKRAKALLEIKRTLIECGVLQADPQ